MTKFTAEEDKQIMDYITNSDSQTKFAEIANIMNINRNSVWKRYNLLKSKNSNKEAAIPKKNITWTRKLTTKFLETLMEVAVCTNVNQLKDLRLPKVVWSELERRMKIDAQELIKFWYRQLHMQLFCQRPISLVGIKEEVMGYFYHAKISSYEGIEWANVTYYFDGVTPHFLQNILYKELVKVTAKTESGNFRENLKYFLDHKDELLAKDENKYLPLVTYANKKLTFLIDEEDHDD